MKSTLLILIFSFILPAMAQSAENIRLKEGEFFRLEESDRLIVQSPTLQKVNLYIIRPTPEGAAGNILRRQLDLISIAKTPVVQAGPENFINKEDIEAAYDEAIENASIDVLRMHLKNLRTELAMNDKKECPKIQCPKCQETKKTAIRGKASKKAAK